MFIGNLSDDTTQKELEDLLSEAGNIIEIFLPTDQSSGRPKGFAFVEFADESSVSVAIEKFNGYEFNGRSLRVSQAEDRPQRSPYPGNQGRKPWQKTSKSSKGKGSRRNLRAKKRGG